MKRLMLVSLVAIISGCASQQIFKKPGPVPRVIESMGDFTLIHLTDGRIIRIRPNDMFVVSDKSPNGVIKRETPLGKLRISLDACQCNTHQILDCYKSHEELLEAYTGYVNDELKKISGQR